MLSSPTLSFFWREQTSFNLTRVFQEFKEVQERTGLAFLRVFSNPGIINPAHCVGEKFEAEEGDQLMVTMWWDLNWMEPWQ